MLNKSSSIGPSSSIGSNANGNSGWCQQENVEYSTTDEMRKPVDSVLGRQLHFQGKNRQLLGSVVASAGIPNGIAMVRELSSPFTLKLDILLIE